MQRATAGKLSPLQEAKQHVVRQAIAHAALDLFASRGFERTTVDDIAAAAGVSRRSFFRYFASKDDVMSQQLVAYGDALVEAIAAVPRTYAPREVVRDVVLRIAARIAEYPRSRQILEIVKASPAARAAQISRRGEVEDRVAQAFAARLDLRAADPKPALLASLVLSIMDVTSRVWSARGRADVTQVAEMVIAELARVICPEAGPVRQRGSSPRRTSR